MANYATLYQDFLTAPEMEPLAARIKYSAAVLMVYLRANEHANALGLYRLTYAYMLDDLKAWSPTMEQLRRDVALLHEAGYCRYDETTSFVWVIDMARDQLLGHAVEPLSPNDKRVKAFQKVYRQMRENPWLEPFFERYGRALHLQRRAIPQPLPLPASAMPLPRGILTPESPVDRDPDPIADLDLGTSDCVLADRSGSSSSDDEEEEAPSVPAPAARSSSSSSRRSPARTFSKQPKPGDKPGASDAWLDRLYRLHRQHLPMATEVPFWTDDLIRHGRRRERSLGDLALWEQGFTRAARSPGLCGSNTRARLVADFEWFICTDDNLRKVLQGNYDTWTGAEHHERIVPFAPSARARTEQQAAWHQQRARNVNHVAEQMHDIAIVDDDPVAVGERQ